MRKRIAFLLVLLVSVAGAMDSPHGKAHKIVKFAVKTKDRQGALDWTVVDESHEVKLQDTYTVGQFNPEPLSEPETTDSVIIGFKICTVPVALASLTKIDNGDEVGDTDEGLFEVSFGYVDPFECQPVTCTAELVCEGGRSVAVEKGQLVEIKMEDDECEIKYEDGRLQTQSSVKLIVTCSNETDSSTAEALPEKLSTDNDQVGEDDD